MKFKSKRLGSSVEDFLREDGILAECEETAIKRVVAWQVAREMERRHLSKSAMAAQMKTSRAALDRLLNGGDSSLTLRTLTRAAEAVGMRVRVELR